LGGESLKEENRTSEDSLLEDHLPSWIYEAIVLDILPWESGRRYSYSDFATKYTFHDSTWIGLFQNLAHENCAVLSIIWDAHWLPDEVYPSTPIVARWPLLFIKLQDVESIITTNLIALDYEREIVESKFRELENGLKALTIRGDGGDVEVRFKGEMIFLGLDRQKEPLAI
jgi:hypothetical protein